MELSGWRAYLAYSQDKAEKSISRVELLAANCGPGVIRVACTTIRPCRSWAYLPDLPLVRGGIDLVIVAELLGHARLETTRGYTRPGAEDRTRALAFLLADE